MTRPGEDELIATYFAPVAGAGSLGLRDDAALLRPRPGHDLVVTVDALVAGVHFFPDDPPGSIAVKALGVNLSDLAAKGAAPVGFLLALALPDDWSPTWLQAFSTALARMAEAHGCPLVGGDTVRTPGPLVLSITAFGSVPEGRMVLRTAARPGDLLFVSGTIGDGALGLHAQSAPWAATLGAADRAFLLDRYRHPQPRTGLAPAVQAHAHAAMDISDGLVGDAAKMLRVSGVSGRIELDRVPLSPAARQAVAADPGCLITALTGGDDYEILAAVPPLAEHVFTDEAAAVGIAVSPIGVVTAGDGGLDLRDREGRIFPVEAGSFQHFR